MATVLVRAENGTFRHCRKFYCTALPYWAPGPQASGAVPPPTAWSSARGSPATFGPVFEDQPLGLLFPEESTEEKVTLACRARASPPATYR